MHLQTQRSRKDTRCRIIREEPIGIELWHLSRRSAQVISSRWNCSSNSGDAGAELEQCKAVASSAL